MIENISIRVADNGYVLRAYAQIVGETHPDGTVSPACHTECVEIYKSIEELTARIGIILKGES